MTDWKLTCIKGSLNQQYTSVRNLHFILELPSALNMNETMFKNSSGSSSSTIAIVNCFINVPLMLAAICGNMLVLTAILTSSFLRSSSSMILLCGLAVSDLAVGLIVQPVFIAQNLAPNDFIDTLYEMMATALCGISLNTMVLISVDRVLAFQFHMSYSTVVTSPRVIVTMILSWLFHFLFSCSTRFFNWKVQFCVSCVLVGIYSIVAAIAYVYVYRIVRRHQLQIHIQQQAVQGSSMAEANTRFMVTGKWTTLNTFIFYICTCFLLSSMAHLSIVFITMFWLSNLGFCKFCLKPSVVLLASSRTSNSS